MVNSAKGITQKNGECFSMIHGGIKVCNGLGNTARCKKKTERINYLERKGCFRHMESYYQEIAHKLFSSLNEVERERNASTVALN